MKTKPKSCGQPKFLNNYKSIRENTASTLYAISTHVKAFGEIPAPTQLASYSWLGINAKAAGGRLSRLKKSEFLISDKEGKLILHPQLIHKQNTAKLLILIFDECTKIRAMRCSVERICEMANLHGIKNSMELINKSHAAGYISIDKFGGQNFITVRDSLRCMLKYLRLIKNGPEDEI